MKLLLRNEGCVCVFSFIEWNLVHGREDRTLKIVLNESLSADLAHRTECCRSKSQEFLRH